jgi:hypothetical protein
MLEWLVELRVTMLGFKELLRVGDRLGIPFTFAINTVMHSVCTEDCKAMSAHLHPVSTEAASGGCLSGQVSCGTLLEPHLRVTPYRRALRAQHCSRLTDILHFIQR